MSQDAVEDVSSPVLQELEAVEAQNSGDDEAHLFSSNQLGICFSYPQGYIQNPNVETVSISAPFLPGAGDTSGYFWLEISDPYDRSALRIADEDMTLAISVGIPRENIGWWSITLGGEEAVVLDGMPGQNFQRRVYVVHDENLYVLGFWPARSENKEIGEQMEALYTAVTRSWSWSPCSGGE